MKALFNSKFINHNINSEVEGSYRIKQFPGEFEEVDADGEKHITLVHTEKYKEYIKHACLNSEINAEVQLTPESWEAAKSAVGLSILAAEQGDFAVIRPPGHHARREKAAGFCFFNNIAIATQHLVNQGNRVFIFDFDGHHGDGTQEIFYYSDKVMFCSVHQAFTFPFSGHDNEIGEGKGKGYTVNYPLIAGANDKAFLDIVDKAISSARSFYPDVVAVSAGFDGYEKDKMLGLKYSLKSYYECGFKLRRAFGNIFAVLEGGYHDDLKECIDYFIDGINVGARPIKNSFDHEMSIG
jgi:acetoin utilization deacetylase AcuC-like enzyme